MSRKDEIDELTKSYLGNSFSYDYESDPLYEAYKNQYESEGKKAMQDTLAQVSSRTGGLASSYATRAAQDTYNGYAQKVSDKIPELYQLALSKYNNDQSALSDKISLLQNQEDTEYSRTQDAYDQALTKAKTLASYGDFSGYQDLGYDTALMQTNYNKSNDTTSTDLLALAKTTGRAEDYENYLKSAYPGMTNEQLDAAMSNYGFDTQLVADPNKTFKSGLEAQDYYSGLGSRDDYTAKYVAKTTYEPTSDDVINQAKKLIGEDSEGETTYDGALEYLRTHTDTASEFKSAAKQIGVPSETIEKFIEDGEDE